MNPFENIICVRLISPPMRWSECIRTFSARPMVKSPTMNRKRVLEVLFKALGGTDADMNRLTALSAPIPGQLRGKDRMRAAFESANQITVDTVPIPGCVKTCSAQIRRLHGRDRMEAAFELENILRSAGVK
jgi:hypothetical protein